MFLPAKIIPVFACLLPAYGSEIGDDGQTLLTSRSLGIGVFSCGGAGRVKTPDIWTMKLTW